MSTRWCSRLQQTIRVDNRLEPLDSMVLTGRTFTSCESEVLNENLWITCELQVNFSGNLNFVNWQIGFANCSSTLNHQPINWKLGIGHFKYFQPVSQWLVVIEQLKKFASSSLLNGIHRKASTVLTVEVVPQCGLHKLVGLLERLTNCGLSMLTLLKLSCFKFGPDFRSLNPSGPKVQVS